MSSVFDDLMLSAQQAVDISHGKLEPARVTKMPIPDVKGIRKRAGFKQSDFAKLIGVSCSLVEAWEQNKRTPTGSSLKLLMLLDKNPDTINQLSTM